MFAIFPEIHAMAQTGAIDPLAQLVRNYFADHSPNTHRLDVAGLYNGIGIQIHTMHHESIGALIARDQNGRIELQALIRPGLPHPEVNFLLAHMLGHVFLHIQPAIARGEWKHSGFKEEHSPILRYTFDTHSAERSLTLDRGRAEASSKPTDAETYEREADTFAAHLLFPQALLDKARKKIPDPQQLSQFFLTTQACMERRLQPETPTSQTASTPPKVGQKAATQRVKDTALSTNRPKRAASKSTHHQGLASSMSQDMNFLEAEARLSKESRVLSRAVDKAANKEVDRTEPKAKLKKHAGSTPRDDQSSDVQPYDQRQNLRQNQRPPQNTPPDSQQKPSPEVISSKGMQRIRDIAKSLDKTGLGKPS